LRAFGILDEREATGASRLAVERTDDLPRLTDLRKVLSQIVFRGLIWEIPNEQSNWWHVTRGEAGIRSCALERRITKRLQGAKLGLQRFEPQSEHVPMRRVTGRNQLSLCARHSQLQCSQPFEAFPLRRGQIPARSLICPGILLLRLYRFAFPTPRHRSDRITLRTLDPISEHFLALLHDAF
jgi:hypothetical protein